MLWQRVNVVFNFFMKKDAQGKDLPYYYKTEECAESIPGSFYLNNSDVHDIY